PAAALLIALADAPGRWLSWARWASVLMAAVMAAAFWIAAPLAVQIDSPEIPGLGPALEASGVLVISGGVFALAAMAGAVLLWRRGGRWPGSWLLALQLPLVAWQVLALVPTGELVDQRRQQPVRQLAEQVRQQQRPGEQLAMVGVNKPSLHYYSRKVVLYAGRPPSGLLDLAEQLPPQAPGTVLVVIDATTAELPHWQDMPHEQLGAAGIYRLWRVPLDALQQRGQALAASGVESTWRLPNLERY
ncbi:MAG: glycosyltransferase family 39 protein, partial [Prochlorococcaceae cyanobacterium]